MSEAGSRMTLRGRCLTTNMTQRPMEGAKTTGWPRSVADNTLRAIAFGSPENSGGVRLAVIQLVRTKPGFTQIVRTP